MTVAVCAVIFDESDSTVTARVLITLSPPSLSLTSTDYDEPLRDACTLPGHCIVGLPYAVTPRVLCPHIDNDGDDPSWHIDSTLMLSGATGMLH